MNLTRQGKNFYRQRMMQIVKGRSMDELSKQELNAAKKKLEKEYGVSVADTVKTFKIFVDAVGNAVEAVGNVLTSIGRNLQGK